MRKRAIMVAIVGNNIDPLWMAIRDFPTERVVLLSERRMLKKAEGVRKDLLKFHIPAQIAILSGNIWEDIFVKIGEIKAAEPKDAEIIINAGTGDRSAGCAATCAAFVNGLKAVSTDEKGAVMLLPVLKFKYYSLVSERKMAILKLLAKHPEGISMEELSRKARMSLPLVSYHVNGNLKSEGLVSLGLVEAEESDGRVIVQISTLGRLLMNGYVKPS